VLHFILVLNHAKAKSLNTKNTLAVSMGNSIGIGSFGM